MHKHAYPVFYLTSQAKPGKTVLHTDKRCIVAFSATIAKVINKDFNFLYL
jgi:hypothetical protein